MTAGDALPGFEGRLIDNRYLLGRRIGSGGFGAVFLSEQRMLGVPIRQVAIKLSRRTGLTVESTRELFADAFVLAEAMGEMTDTRTRRHLVHVYDAGLIADGRAYLSMEYVHGTTLAAQFASYEKVPSRLVLNWARQIGTALRGLHGLDRPLLHRDLKPDNVLLGTDRTVRLVDFGLAARLLRLGHAPGVAGTLAYMAPETIRGESVPASDLYSLGLLMYEGLTGRHPFADLVPPADVPSALHGEWLHDEKRRLRPDPPSTLNNTVTGHLDEVVLRCLEFESVRRYHDAAELLEALETPATSLGESPLRKARRLLSEGDAPGALDMLEHAVAAEPPPDTLLPLLDMLGEVLTETGDHGAAAARFRDCWNLVERHPTLVRTRQERSAVAQRAAMAFERAGNRFMTARFRWIADTEASRGGEGR